LPELGLLTEAGLLVNVYTALKHTKGILYKYAKMVASASKGCITDA
jgi:hypothetical protein